MFSIMQNLKNKKKIEEIKEFIEIGFPRPSLYKRSVWRKAERIMEFLRKEFPSEIKAVKRSDIKYVMVGEGFPFDRYAQAYYKHQPDLQVADILPDMQEFADAYGMALNDGATVELFFQKNNEYQNK